MLILFQYSHPTVTFLNLVFLNLVGYDRYTLDHVDRDPKEDEKG
jgi:hypothetical protein